MNLNKHIASIKKAQDLAPCNSERFLSTKDAWMKDVRVMLANKEMGVTTQIMPVVSFHFLAWVRPMASLAAVFLFVITGGSMAVYGSLQSLPGDSLYSVKLGVERLRLDLARSPEKKTAVLFALANERLAEADKMLQTEQRPSVKVAVQEFKTKMEKTKQLAEQAPEKTIEIMTEMTALIEENTLVMAMKASDESEAQAVSDRLAAAEKAAQEEAQKVQDDLTKEIIAVQPEIKPVAQAPEPVHNPFDVKANLLYTPYQPKP